MTSAQVVQMSVTINDSPIQDYAHPDDHEKKILENPSWAKENSTWMHHLHHNLISQEIDRKVLTSCGSTPKSLQSFSTPSGPIVSGSSWPLSEQKNKNSTLLHYCIIMWKLIQMYY